MARIYELHRVAMYCRFGSESLSQGTTTDLSKPLPRIYRTNCVDRLPTITHIVLLFIPYKSSIYQCR